MATSPAVAHDPSLPDIRSQDGVLLSDLSYAAPVLLVFLRHLGCSFCRQTLDDLRRARPALERHGIGLALVHMSDESAAESVFQRYGLDDVHRFSDPDRRAYRAFGLKRMHRRKLFSPSLIAEAWHAGVVEGHGMGRVRGDVFQLPGVFLLDRGRILAGHRFVRPSDRPDYEVIVQQLLPVCA